MVKVKVRVSNLAIDLVPGEQVIYKKGNEFDCPLDRAIRLGNSIQIIENIAEPEIIIEKPEPTVTKKTR